MSEPITKPRVSAAAKIALVLAAAAVLLAVFALAAPGSRFFFPLVSLWCNLALFACVLLVLRVAGIKFDLFHKAGLIGLTKALAKEEGPSGITVNCVAPGVIETDMMAAFTAEDKAALAEETPVGRLGTPEEVAKLLVFLAGEDAGYITGQVFGVNGGLVI